MAQPQENKADKPNLVKTLSHALERSFSRTDQPRRSSEEKEKRDSVSPRGETRKHIPQGRGGAGNYTDHPSPMISPDDLATPTLKNDFYTTGRGGTGNMAKNTDAEDARRAQDVVPLPRYESATDVHVGRGGAANTVHVPPQEIEASQRDKRMLEATVSRVSQSDETHDDESTINAGEGNKAVKWIKKKLNMKEGSSSNNKTTAA